MNLKNQNVLITGGSQGLGLALASELVERGARVALVARGAETLDRAVSSLCARGGVAHGIVADVGDPEAAARILGAATEALGGVEVLVHNASTLGPTPLRPLLELEPEEIDEVFRVNVLGPFALGRAAAGPMALRGSGTIVSISSDAAVEAYPTWGAYGASKAALDHLHRVWAEELRPQGIRVWALDPGEMRTAMHAAAMPEADPEGLRAPEAVAQDILRLIEGRARLPAVRGAVSELAEVRS